MYIYKELAQAVVDQYPDQYYETYYECILKEYPYASEKLANDIFEAVLTDVLQTSYKKV